MSADAAIQPQGPDASLLHFARCQLCHTTSAAITNQAVAGGVLWHCERCGQGWSAPRLAAVTAYRAWMARRPAEPGR